MYTVILTQEAAEGARLLRKSNAVAYKKLAKLIEELKLHPYIGTGHPEPLRYIPGMWSRHIDKNNRLVYQVKDHEIIVTVVSVIGHYDDK